MMDRSLGAPRPAGSWRQAGAALGWIAFLSAAPVAPIASAAHAQLIAVKTAPVADGVQFGFLPSPNLGMGGLSIALPDSTVDPFLNPAKGSWLRGTRVFGAPTFYSVSRRAGGGVTMPLGTSISSGPWFSQFAIALQDIDRESPGFVGFPFAAVRPEGTTLLDQGMAIDGEEKPSRQNRYLHATVGRRLAGQRLSVAASASWWGIRAVDGVDLYYPGNQSVRQHGDAVDLRLGLLKEWRGGESLEALIVRNRFAVNQDVAFSDVFWDPTLRQLVSVPRVEPNADRTETWGLQLGYTRPLADSTWRVGGKVTGNRIRQPRLPNYGGLPQVSADAGRAHAYDIGAGVAHSGGPWTFGADAIFEPIWSRSWDHLDRTTEMPNGTSLSAGARALDNRFRFTNGIVRAGFGATAPLSATTAITFETGGQLRAVRYRLEQSDLVRRTESASTQSWNEWTRSWGVNLRFAGASLHYRGRLTTGAGRPGFDDIGGGVIDVATLRSSFAPGPGDPFGSFNPAFDDVSVTVHQVSLSVALR